MKKVLCWVLVAGLVCGGLTGCKKAASKPAPAAKDASAAAVAEKEPSVQEKPEPETMTLIAKTDVKLSDKPALLPNGSFEKWQPGEPAPKNFNAPEGGRSAIRKELKDVADGVLAVSQTWQALDGKDSFLNKFGANVEGLKAHGNYTFELKAKNPSDKHVVVAAWQDTGSQANPFERIKEAVIDIPPKTNEFKTFTCPLVPNTERSIRIFSGCNDKQGTFPAVVIWDDWKITETTAASAGGTGDAKKTP